MEAMETNARQPDKVVLDYGGPRRDAHRDALPADVGTLTSRDLLAKLQPLIALALMVLVLSLFAPTFRTQENGVNILREISVNLCLSIGMTMVILTAGIDLSVGAVLALAGVVAAGLLKNGLVFPRLAVISHREFLKCAE